MRLKYATYLQYMETLDFWRDSCRYEDKSVYKKVHCCNPKVAEYQEQNSQLWQEWCAAGRKGKPPILPPTVECEKCEYANLSLGKYDGESSSRPITGHVEGTIPVPLKGRKKVWIHNVNQKLLESILDEIDNDIEAFALTGSPKIEDFSFLERFHDLKLVNIWWNNKAAALWDMSKTPNLEYLYLRAITNLTDISQIANAKKLRCLFLYAGNENIQSLRPFENHPALEFVVLLRPLADTNLRSLIDVPNLKYLNCHVRLFDINAYAEFEAKRPDVDTNFWEGVEGFAETNYSSYYVQLVGSRQRTVKPDDYEKQEKHRQKYLAIKQKYLTTSE